MDHDPRILVVDDELLSRDVLVRRLAANGIKAIPLPDAESCLTSVAEHVPDLILLDVSMPGISGLDLLTSLRKAWSKQQLPVILVTALMDSEDVVTGLAAGANDYVIKPVTMPVLIARMEVCLELGRALRERARVEAALQHANDTLEHRVERRTAELATANQQLREEIEEKLRAEGQLVSYQNQLRTLAARLSVVEEEERRRIAAGLHDDVGQVLALIRMKLGMPDWSQPELMELLDEAIRATRSLTFDLGSRIIYEFGLEAALESLVEKTKARHQINITFEDDERPKPLSENTRLVVFRATREAIHNIIKHARADAVSVGIHRQGNTVIIHVADNGAGFVPPEAGKHHPTIRGYGLFNIQEQLSCVRGHMSIESSPGHGSRVVFAVPIDASQDVTETESAVAAAHSISR